MNSPVSFYLFCSGINECLINNGGCAQICTDTADSFQCSCTSGFMLAGNSLDCVGKILTKVVEAEKYVQI